MKRQACFSLAAAILINASAYAGGLAGAAEGKDFASFLKDYQVFMEKRNIDNQRYTAGFRGNFVFKATCSPSFYQGEGDEACECPVGNRYLQCLTAAQAVITADPNDIGGRGYVLVMSDTSFLDPSGLWKPMPQRNAYTTIIGRIEQTNVINIPIPDKATVDRLCSGKDSAKPFALTVGYGAVMPMEMEFAHRMKDRSAQMGQSFDDGAYIFSRARLNGTRPRKAGEIGSAVCRTANQSG